MMTSGRVAAAARSNGTRGARGTHCTPLRAGQRQPTLAALAAGRRRRRSTPDVHACTHTHAHTRTQLRHDLGRGVGQSKHEGVARHAQQHLRRQKVAGLGRVRVPGGCGGARWAAARRVAWQRVHRGLCDWVCSMPMICRSWPPRLPRAQHTHTPTPTLATAQPRMQQPHHAARAPRAPGTRQRRRRPP
jgi:hypothetical protein